MIVVVVLPERDCDSPHMNSGETWSTFHEATCFYLTVKRSKGNNAYFLIKGLVFGEQAESLSLPHAVTSMHTNPSMTPFVYDLY
jgi:hypothetical protein